MIGRAPTILHQAAPPATAYTGRAAAGSAVRDRGAAGVIGSSVVTDEAWLRPRATAQAVAAHPATSGPRRKSLSQ